MTTERKNSFLLKIVFIFLGLFIFASPILSDSIGFVADYHYQNKRLAVDLTNHSYSGSGATEVMYQVHWCRKGASVGKVECGSESFGEKKADEQLVKRAISITLPKKGASNRIQLPDVEGLRNKTCGRFQVDLSIPKRFAAADNGYIGGEIFVLGNDCDAGTGGTVVTVQSSPSPSPSVSPSPSPSPSSSPTSNQQPECVSLSAHPTLGGAQLNVTFVGKGRDLDGKIKRMEFNFGDGTSENKDLDGETNKDTEVGLSHVYKDPGTYVASVRVKDNSGQSNEWSSTPESCKVTIKVEGQVLGTTSTVTTLPKAGVSELFNGLWLGLAGSGLWIKRWARRKLYENEY